MLPSKVVLIARGQWSEGMAVNLRVHMKRKNNHNVIVFLDRAGRAEVRREELEQRMRDDAESFLMDYAGWAAAYGGKITARILGMEEIDRALEAHSIYRTMCRYPAGYREALLRARQLPTPEGSCSVAVKKSQ